MYGYGYNYGQPQPQQPQYGYMQQAGSKTAGLLPYQQVIQVNGKASADSIQLAPNSSVIVADKNAPVIYMCVSDGVGNVTATAYDIMPHQDKPPVDVNGLENRIEKIEKFIAGMEERSNAKPTFRPDKAKPSDTKFSAD